LIERKEPVAKRSYSVLVLLMRIEMPRLQHDAFDDELQARVEDYVRREYERCRPNDTFEAMKRRARFEKDSKGLLRDWLEAGRRRIAAEADAEQSTYAAAAE
jgi:hypothetical protein